jgi:hypothetical protein
VGKRIDPPDTVDQAVHWLIALQAEGWGMVDISQHMDYATVGKQSLPVTAQVTITLRPCR